MGCVGKPTVRINNLIEEQQMRSIWIFGAWYKNVCELSVSKQCPESSEPHQKDEKVNRTAVVYWLIDTLVVLYERHLQITTNTWRSFTFSAKSPRNDNLLVGRKNGAKNCCISRMNETNTTVSGTLYPRFINRNVLVDTTDDLIIGVVVLVLVILCTFACCVTVAKKCSVERRMEYQPSDQYYTKVPTASRGPVTEVWCTSTIRRKLCIGHQPISGLPRYNPIHYYSKFCKGVKQGIQLACIRCRNAQEIS